MRPILNSFRRAIEAADATREDIISDVRVISVVLGATAVAVLLVVIGIIICVFQRCAEVSYEQRLDGVVSRDQCAAGRGRAELSDLDQDRKYQCRPDSQ